MALKRTPSMTPPPWPPDAETIAIIEAVRPLRDNPDVMVEVLNAMVEYCLITETPKLIES